MPGRYDDDDGPAAGGEGLGGPIFEGVYFTSRYVHTKYRLRNIEQISPETSIVFEQVSGDIWLIFNRAIFGHSRHSKYRPNN